MLLIKKKAFITEKKIFDEDIDLNHILTRIQQSLLIKLLLKTKTFLS